MAQAIWTQLAQSELDDILFYISVQAGQPETDELNYYEIRRAADGYADPKAPRHTHPDAPEGWFYF